MIHSPLNYVGNKFSLLPELLPRFPKVNKFVDLFCGGLTVGINVDCKEIVANDKLKQVIDLYQYWKETPLEQILDEIRHIRNSLRLDCWNSIGYAQLQAAYIRNKHPAILYCLTRMSFNFHIRFNARGEFNVPFGKNRGTFNDTSLVTFIEKLKAIKVTLTCMDFTEVSSTSAFVYADPPYQGTTATYNESGWSLEDDERLFSYLDNCQFGYSNVASPRVLEWASKYKITYLEKDYSNCNYHRKKRDLQEIYVTNV